VDSNGQRFTYIRKGFGPFNFHTIDSGHLINKIVADSRLYQRRDDGTILIYQGGTSWAVAPTPYSSLAQDVEAGASSDAVYWELPDHSAWQYTPETSFWEISTASPENLQMSRQGW